MKHLYPLKFNPVFKEKIWGGNKLKTVLDKDFSPLPNAGESWEISAVQDNISEVKNGFLAENNLQEIIEIYMGDLVGDKVYKKFGIEFPLLIKFIDANDKLSIQVHPDDKTSKKRHKAYGKTEMWYVIQADKGANLISGFNKKVDKATYLEYLRSNKLAEILNYEPVKPGDVFFIPAGRVHAIGQGILLAEIQQTSDVTYRIYDFDRRDANGNTRQLHTDMAIDVIDFELYDKYKTDYNVKQNQVNPVISCQYFTTNLLEFNRKLQLDYATIDSFVIYMCLEGEFEIQDQHGQKTTVSQGETVLVPAVLENLVLTPGQKTKALEVYIDIPAD